VVVDELRRVVREVLGRAPLDGQPVERDLVAPAGLVALAHVQRHVDARLARRGGDVLGMEGALGRAVRHGGQPAAPDALLRVQEGRRRPLLLRGERARRAARCSGGEGGEVHVWRR
jgi:hypothetical protein